MMIGANPEELEELALELDRGAETLQRIYSGLLRLVEQSSWSGPDQSQFLADWRNPVHAHVVSAQRFMTEGAVVVRRNSSEQTDASGLSSASGSYDSEVHGVLGSQQPDRDWGIDGRGPGKNDGGSGPGGVLGSQQPDRDWGIDGRGPGKDDGGSGSGGVLGQQQPDRDWGIDGNGSRR